MPYVSSLRLNWSATVGLGINDGNPKLCNTFNIYLYYI